MNNLDSLYETLINTVVEDKEYGSMYFSRPVLPFQEYLFKTAYDYSHEINDSFEEWSDFDKTYLVSCIDPDTQKFIAFINFGYSSWLNACTVDTYLHPDSSYRDLKNIGILFSKLYYKSALDIQKKSIGFFSNFASNYLLKYMCPHLVPDYKQDVVKHFIYDRYTVFYYDLNQEDAKYMIKDTVFCKKLDPKFLLQTCFNSFYQLYGYQDNTDFLSILPKDSKFFYDEKDIGSIKGLYSITNRQFDTSSYELGLEVYPYDVNNKLSFLEYVLQDFLEFYTSSKYKHFECVVSSQEEADLIKKYLNTSSYKITDNYFICHKAGRTVMLKFNIDPSTFDGDNNPPETQVDNIVVVNPDGNWHLYNHGHLELTRDCDIEYRNLWSLPKEWMFQSSNNFLIIGGGDYQLIDNFLDHGDQADIVDPCIKDYEEWHHFYLGHRYNYYQHIVTQIPLTFNQYLSTYNNTEYDLVLIDISEPVMGITDEIYCEDFFINLKKINSDRFMMYMPSTVYNKLIPLLRKHFNMVQSKGKFVKDWNEYCDIISFTRK